MAWPFSPNAWAVCAGTLTQAPRITAGAKQLYSIFILLGSGSTVLT